MSSHLHPLHQLDFNTTVNPYVKKLLGAKLTSAHKDKKNKINVFHLFNNSVKQNVCYTLDF